MQRINKKENYLDTLISFTGDDENLISQEQNNT